MFPILESCLDQACLGRCRQRQRETYWCLLGTGWWLLGGRRHGWHLQTEQPWSPGLWTRPELDKGEETVIFKTMRWFNIETVTYFKWEITNVLIRSPRIRVEGVLLHPEIHTKVTRSYSSSRFLISPLKRGWTGGHVWTAPRQLHGCCCDKLRQSGSGPLRSSSRWWRCRPGS